jgi:PP-loop superfamily ATP-utilizing enzyme
MVGSYTESFLNDIVTTLLFSKTMHNITLIEVDEDQCWYLLNENETKQMSLKVAGHITSIDI